ncbi:hypothetical protein J4772_36330 [Cohnella sp. LGH]|uniref:Uncharacterized protein n=1 Tax=Cohnella phaseoli TaxID=456490 RepID=A0A3D9KAX7_9BACL|nr:MULTISPECIES: hypothetical protein [Cohnella]QTH42841.1 hypothetical protein J4772_36330 [Cohnella sp. LGH]RED83300.1 hypothetical protein DFP98_108143 [Cohnella phaseoli]
MNTTSLQKDDDSAKSFARIATFIYAAALLVTAALVLLLGLPSSRANHIWITLSTLVLGETFLYGIAVHYLGNRPASRRLLPVYIAMGIVAGLSWVGTLVLMLVFSVALNISSFYYGLIQFIVVGAAAILLGLLTIYLRNAARQEQGT